MCVNNLFLSLKSFKCDETDSPLQFPPLTAEKAFVAPYGVQRFLTGCGTTTGPVVVLQCSHWQPPVLVVGSLFFPFFFLFFFNGSTCLWFCLLGGSHIHHSN